MNRAGRTGLGNKLASVFLTLLALSQSISGEANSDDLTLDVAVKLKDQYSDDIVSELFAISHDLVKIAKVIELDENGLFHFRIKNPELYEGDMEPSQMASDGHHRRKRHVENKIENMRNDDRVVWVEAQGYLKREKRNYEIRNIQNYLRSFDLDDLDNNEEVDVDERTLDKFLESFDEEEPIESDKKLLENYLKKLEAYTEPNDEEEDEEDIVQKFHRDDLPKAIDFNDESFGQQWYLINEGQMNIPPMHDMNVKDAWLNGYTGKGVSIVIVDDGIDHEHPDFEGKYRPDLSYDLNDEDDVKHDPMPGTFDDNNNHGTKCAGAAAAKANNLVCGVGVAHGADIGGIRILDGKITDMLEARALLFKMNDTDIKTMSWGPQDDGTHMEHPQKFVSQALETGVKMGRNGKGTLFVFASGNGGYNDDDCSCDGYVSNWNVISIGSINHHGVSTSYSELCPSTMAVAYTGGRSKYGGEYDDPGVRVSTTNVRGECDSLFQGTSAAAPIAAGVFALVLESNPNLAYRDIMHLIARTSRVPNIEDSEGWIINGAEYHVNEKYGFGVLDAAQMIQEAQDWENVPPRQMCSIKSANTLPLLKPGEAIETDIEVNEKDCPEINFLEHVVANISFTYPIRGQLSLTLISPSGTPSELLSYRKNDKSAEGIEYFPFMSVFNWGESPVGKWRLIAETKNPKNDDDNAIFEDEATNGSIDSFSLNFFGFKGDKVKANKRSHGPIRSFVPSEEHVKEIYNFERTLKEEAATQLKPAKKNA